MKKRILTLTLAAALMAVPLAGCGAQEQAQEQEQVQETVDFTEMEEQGAMVDLGALLDEGVPLAGAPVGGVLPTTAPGTQVEENSSALVDYSNAKDGYVMAKWLAGGSDRVKVLVKGPSTTTYQYNLNLNGDYEAFPLSDGSGAYIVGVYKNISGSEYATILSATVNTTLTDEFAPFLRPNQYVNFSEGSTAVAKAAELCAGASDNLSKVEPIYTYVVNNVTYDTQKAETVASGYLPNVDETLATGKGICFDYAALMAAMLRSQGVPVKLVVGYTGSAYHAWLSVYSETDGWIEGKIYFDGTEWKLMDPTFASSSNSSESVMQYIGNGSNYSAKYLY